MTYSTSVPPPQKKQQKKKTAMCYHFCFALKKLPCCLRSLSWTVLVRLKCVTLPRREHENQRLLNSEVSMPWPVTMEADASSYLPVVTGLHPVSKSRSRLDFSSSPSELVCSSIGAVIEQVIGLDFVCTVQGAALM